MEFLEAWVDDLAPDTRIQRVLDPCAGGNTKPVDWEYKPAKGGKPAEMVHVPVTPMSYPTALQRVFGSGLTVVTNDIREDSPAEYHMDVRKMPALTKTPYDLVATNPPFSLAMEVIEASLKMVRDGGLVVMLLRLNFLEGAERFPFMQSNPPQRAYVHHRRMGFLPGAKKTDSIAYMHAVWQRGYASNHTIMRVI